MTQRSTEHGSFVIERTYAVSPARIFAAFSSLEAKKQWFNGPADLEPVEHTLDFTVGGHEFLKIAVPDGPVFTFDSTYQDIVPDQRIIHTYEMHMNGDRISVSVAAVEFTPAGSSTTLTMTEHGVFLDGLDTCEQRRQGTEEFLEAIGKALEESA